MRQWELNIVFNALSVFQENWLSIWFHFSGRLYFSSVLSYLSNYLNMTWVTIFVTHTMVACMVFCHLVIIIEVRTRFWYFNRDQIICGKISKIFMIIILGFINNCMLFTYLLSIVFKLDWFANVHNKINCSSFLVIIINSDW